MNKLLNTKKFILLILVFLFDFVSLLLINSHLIQAADNSPKLGIFTPPPTFTPTATTTPTPSANTINTITPTIYLTITVTPIITPPLSSACGYPLSNAAKTIVNDWPVGYRWNYLTMCTQSCTDSVGNLLTGIDCTQTPYAGTDIYNGNCEGLVCTDLILASYDISNCGLPTDSRWAYTIWQTFNTDPNLHYYQNGNPDHDLEPGDTLFFGSYDYSIISHVAMASDLMSNGFFMQNLNARRVYFLPKITGLVNTYEGPFSTNNHLLLGWGRKAY